MPAPIDTLRLSRLAATASLLLAGVSAPAGAQFDIADLVQQQREAKREESDFLVLVSFAMPTESLSRLARDSSRIGAPLLLRGLHENSVSKTAVLLRRLDQQQQGDWQVDPRVFRQLEIKAVPAFALRTSEGWQIVRGDVSIAYALREFATSSGPARMPALRLAALLGRKE